MGMRIVLSSTALMQLLNVSILLLFLLAPYDELSAAGLKPAFSFLSLCMCSAGSIVSHLFRPSGWSAVG